MPKTLSIAVIAAGFAAASAQAQDKPAETVKEVRQIVVHSQAKDGKAAEHRAIPPEVRAKIANCEGQKFEADATSGADKDKRRTHIVLCGKKDATKAETAAMLESAVKRLETNQELPAENKERILAQLKAKIAELKAN